MRRSPRPLLGRRSGARRALPRARARTAQISADLPTTPTPPPPATPREGDVAAEELGIDGGLRALLHAADGVHRHEVHREAAVHVLVPLVQHQPDEVEAGHEVLREVDVLDNGQLRIVRRLLVARGSAAGMRNAHERREAAEKEAHPPSCRPLSLDNPLVDLLDSREER